MSEENKIKVLVVNERDTGGGAARASCAIFKAIQRCGIVAEMFVQRK